MTRVKAIIYADSIESLKDIKVNAISCESKATIIETRSKLIVEWIFENAIQSNVLDELWSECINLDMIHFLKGDVEAVYMDVID